MKTITIKLYGGLGNQLFQYAAGRALALRNEAHLKLDISWFKNKKDRPYALDAFHIQGETITQKKNLFTGLQKCIKKALGEKKIKESTPHFSPEILHTPSPVLLDGYWQSECYFADYTATIRKDFTFKNDLSPINKNRLYLIENTQAISLHVRRGDYLTEAHKVHGTLKLSYYQKAIEIICSNLAQKPTFFVFSDDINWAKTHLPLSDHTHFFISGNNAPQHWQDVRLMAACKHHIIANSSFSWWGAWLNGAPEKQVIAPKRWLNLEPQNKDILPASWLQL